VVKIIADEHIPYVQDYFGTCGELIVKSGRHISHDDVKDADMLLVRSITRVDEALLVNSAVKFVGSITAGADHLDTHYLDRAGIAWSRAAGFNAQPVADYVVSVVAALQRKNLLSQYGARVAVIGVGHVGTLVVKHLKALNCEIIYCDPLRAEQEPDFVSTPIDDIADVDMICLHVPLTKTGKYPTHHFINQSFLQRQKQGCVLLNAGRGAVINTQDLLQYGTHLPWCFDVWEDEPHIDKTVLAHALIATPHIAGYSVQGRMRGVAMIYEAAMANNMIQATSQSPKKMPQQQLTFAGHQHHWQDIILGVFNPLVMTSMMHSLLFTSENTAEPFDLLRNQFQYRHEFGFTNITDVELLSHDAAVLRQLGIGLF
jgi:erythronate-4-phosphate dehydrogenase